MSSARVDPAQRRNLAWRWTTLPSTQRNVRRSLLLLRLPLNLLLLLLLLLLKVRGGRTTKTTTTTTGGAVSDFLGGGPSSPPPPPHTPWVQLMGRPFRCFVRSLQAPLLSWQQSYSGGSPTECLQDNNNDDVRGDTGNLPPPSGRDSYSNHSGTFVNTAKVMDEGGTDHDRELGRDGNPLIRNDTNYNNNFDLAAKEEGRFIGMNEIIHVNSSTKGDDNNNNNNTGPLSSLWPSPLNPSPLLQAVRGDRFGRTVASDDPLAHHPHNRQRPGCIDLDLAGSTILAGLPGLARKRPPPQIRQEVHGNGRRFPPALRSDPPVSAIEASVQLDPASTLRLAQVSGTALVCFGSALLGTLRLLAPLIVARRGLNWLGDVVTDWYRGHYLRTTYQRMEHQYYRYYQGPAVFRSLGRLVSQLALLFALGRVMEWMVGLSHAPCVLTDSGGCHWWCGALWLVAVIGTGHAGAAAIALWGGPLRIQIRADRHGATAAQAGTGADAPPRRPSARHVFARPWRLLQWMRDPDQWIRAMAAAQRFPGPFANDLSRHDEPLRPFRPDPLLFPATWEPLRALHLLGLAREMTTPCHHRMRAIMRRALIQQAFADEWYRVLLCERRIAIGMLAMAGYLISALSVFWTAATARPATASGPTALLLLPHLASVVVSAYVNVFVYHDLRRATKKQRAQSNPTATASVRGPPSAADFWLQGKFVVKSVQW